MMKHRLLLPVALLMLLLANAEARRVSGDEVEGLWKPVDAEMGGVKFPPEAIKNWRLELAKGKYVLQGAESPDQGTYVIDSTKKPRTMDILGTEGPNKGKAFPCIYEIDGDTMRICYDLAGKMRPAEFKTAKQTKEYLVTYHREKR
jgi:uncharacterized protein (TIGR03067 family)